MVDRDCPGCSSGSEPTANFIALPCAVHILLREAGKGDRPKGGGRGVGREDNLFAARPLHNASHGPPPPLRFAPRGRKNYVRPVSFRAASRWLKLCTGAHIKRR